MVSKSWGKAISGPVLAVAGLVLLVMQSVITDAPTATKVLKCGSWLTLGLAAIMIFVAQYDAWADQRQAKIGAEAQLKSTLDALKGPEVCLSFQSSAGFFTVENRSLDTDAIKVWFDPLETKRYRLECEVLSHLRHGTTQALKGAMIDKTERTRFMAIDLKDVLDDTCQNYKCELNFLLKYSDSRGHRSKRKVTISGNQVALKMQFAPEIVHHEIEPDRDATGAL